MSENKIQWQPVSVMLEDAAEKAVLSTSNIEVIAGPGAGKTELLAQRASFLLETGVCEAPRRILAISFKSDAAKNLEDRVTLRCGKELARRFESRTYDSFAKGLLDHFRLGLEELYRPSKDYDVITSWEAIKSVAEKNFPAISEQKNNFWRTLTDSRLARQRLPLVVGGDFTSKLVFNLWRVLVSGSSISIPGLTFQMISRLAEYLLRTNPIILHALRTTYSHVFLDEFQDTTNIQYDLLCTAFLGSETVITAVGDDKQRIMGWAGAMEDAFGTFKNDFCASEIRLIMNHRSAPKLVEIQNVIAKKLDNEAIEVRPSEKWSQMEGICEVWKFSHYEKEAQYIAEQVQFWVQEEQLRPREICIVVKQSEVLYAKAIMSEFAKKGIHSRIEKDYQDILSEEITEVYLAMILLATSHRAAEERQSVFDLFLVLQGIDNEDFRPDHIYEADEKLEKFIDIFGDCLSKIASKDDLKFLLAKIVPFLGEAPFKNKFPRYSRGDWLNIVTEKIAEKLWESYQISAVWQEAIKNFKGEQSIPIMTIHKSKGLEYDSVIFVGMEDKAFWNFMNQKEEDKKAFFVAMSRAKKRMIFTFSEYREVKNYGSMELVEQFSKNIGELYEILQEAGVDVVTPEN